ncbi:MAG TPA: transporter substrate-binding domain-containing protein [Thermotogota bacterium]|nr:transporter substrate-binding domain-containing protein [Thermotogota bacterium]HPJ89164.1 transporter substrate-binding domain-containing protein [Thermotogota bacterium]HPR95673.1 transporter substrate-binding domain-containing protein [Thermotogota bacterium]
MIRKSVFLLILFFVLPFSLSFSVKIVSIAIGEYPPYTSEFDENARMTEELVKEAFNLEGYVVETGYYPWKRAYEMVKEGEADATFPWIKTEERTVEFLFPEETLIEAREVFFYLKTLDFDWKDYEDLKAYRVGGTRGYAHTELFKEYDIPYDEATSDESNFKKLLTGRIDIFPIDFIVGYYLINELFGVERAPLFNNHPKPFIADKWAIMFSRKREGTEELVRAFDSGMKRLMESGRYEEIVYRYLGIE